MSSWVASEIVLQKDEKLRLLTVLRFIEILEVKIDKNLYKKLLIYL